MTTPAVTNFSKRHRFPAEIISHRVRFHFAKGYRQELTQRFQTWQEITGTAAAA